jgi:hypothetical protein
MARHGLPARYNRAMAHAAQPGASVTAFNEALWRHDDAAIARLIGRIEPNIVATPAAARRVRRRSDPARPVTACGNHGDSERQKEPRMRVMVIVKASKSSEDGVLPTKQEFRDMGAFNDELIKAGVMVFGDGLQPSRKGKRVRFARGGTTVIDGPFTETKELVAGFWIWQVASMDEAVAWARRCPCAMPGGEAELEIRAFNEAEDLGPELAEDMRAHEEQRRAQEVRLRAGR